MSQKRWVGVARAVLFVGGLGLAAWLIRGVGVPRLLAVLSETWHWVPLVALFEVLFVSMDWVALRFILGDKAGLVPVVSWVRASAVAYASTILLPAGRAAGEAGRATTLAPSLGASDAVAACTRLQACVLLANAGISTVIVTVMLTQRGWASSLVPLLMGNLAVCTAIGGGILLLLASGRVASWLKRHLRRFEEGREPGNLKPSRRQVASAVASCLVGRLFQTLQFSVAVHAVGGLANPVTGFAAQGTHLVGAALGDLVPGQVGVAEGAFRAFAETLGLGADPARALSIALLVRVAQLSLASLSVVTAVLARRRVSEDGPSATAGRTPE
jgi:hypothetical protein